MSIDISRHQDVQTLYDVAVPGVWSVVVNDFNMEAYRNIYMQEHWRVSPTGKEAQYSGEGGGQTPVAIMAPADTNPLMYSILSIESWHLPCYTVSQLIHLCDWPLIIMHTCTVQMTSTGKKWPYLESLSCGGFVAGNMKSLVTKHNGIQYTPNWHINYVLKLYCTCTYMCAYNEVYSVHYFLPSMLMYEHRSPPTIWVLQPIHGCNRGLMQPYSLCWWR